MFGKLVVLTGAIALFVCLATVPRAEAASFDCARAAKPAEFAICANPKLSELDVEMSTLYWVRMQLPMLMGARGAAQDEQRQFLVDRDACGATVSCIQSRYQARNAALRRTIQAGMQDYCVKAGIC